MGKNTKKGKMLRAVRPSLDGEHDLDLWSGVRPAEKKCRYNKLPGKAEGRRSRQSEFSVLMCTKQAMKRYFGVLEKPFKNCYKLAAKRQGSTADNLLLLLESRLDNVVYRSGFASTRAEAKQIVSHGHVIVNGRRTTVSSYKVRQGDIISLSKAAQKHERIASALSIAKQKDPATWLDVDPSEFKAVVSGEPTLEQLYTLFKVNHVIELYSK